MADSTVSIRRDYVDSRFGQVHVRLASPEKPNARSLMCFHLTPFSGVLYETWLAEMGKDRLAVAVDTPGFGNSDNPTASLTMTDYAHVMGDVMDALGVTDVDLMGYHTGGRIAVQLALLQPGTVKNIVLVGAGMYTPEEQKKHYAALAGDDELKDDGSHLLATWRSSIRWRGPDRTLADLMKTFPDLLRGRYQSGLMYQANVEFSYTEKLKDVQQPILVLNPNDDLYPYTPRIAPHLKAGDKLIDLPDWGMGFLDYHTEETAALVRDFVDGNSSGQVS